MDTIHPNMDIMDQIIVVYPITVDIHHHTITAMRVHCHTMDRIAITITRIATTMGITITITIITTIDSVLLTTEEATGWEIIRHHHTTTLITVGLGITTAMDSIIVAEDRITNLEGTGTNEAVPVPHQALAEDVALLGME